MEPILPHALERPLKRTNKKRILEVDEAPTTGKLGKKRCGNDLHHISFLTKFFHIRFIKVVSIFEAPSRFEVATTFKVKSANTKEVESTPPIFWSASNFKPEPTSSYNN
ncbi:hypothetical protein V6N13_088752 [Hibiscus sabdariffa]